VLCVGGGGGGGGGGAHLREIGMVVVCLKTITIGRRGRGGGGAAKLTG